MEGHSDTSRRRLVAAFTGHVQGVGFRFTTVEVARNFEITGFVQNMPDGSVHLVAEGFEDDIMNFLGAIRGSHIYHYVTRESLDWQQPRGDMNSFGIRYA